MTSLALVDRWRLHPQVAVRPEPFGALLYHFGTRRLSFLKDRALTAVVIGLDGAASVREACAAAGVTDPPEQLVGALETLARSGMIVKEPT